MRENWKLWLTGLIVAVVLGIAVTRLRSSFGEKPPDWLRLQNLTSPQLNAASRKQFIYFRKEIELESTTTSLPIQSLQLIEWVTGGKELRTWSIEKYSNAGMTPLGNLEVPRAVADDRPVGFYTMEGEPLDYTLRHMPARPKTAIGVVHLDKPLASGASCYVVYIERQTNYLKPNARGEFAYRFGMLRSGGNFIQAVGFLLPEDFQVVRYTPSIGSSESVGGAPLIGWINTRIEKDSLPPMVTFKKR